MQPHAGAQANVAVMEALMEPGDTLMGLSLDHGGHLTHGMPLNFSGRRHNIVAYEVDRQTFRIDMDKVREQALAEKPAVIVAGWSAYPRQLDFEAFASIAQEVGAKLWVDMAHFAGLVAAGLHPNPVPHADVVSSTVHKTLGGPRSGFILAKEEYGKKINSRVFPGQQGGPLMHAIAGKAVAFKIAASEEFKRRQQRTLEGAQILASRLTESDVADAGVSVLTGGTDVHLVLVDLRNSELDGKQGRTFWTKWVSPSQLGAMGSPPTNDHFWSASVPCAGHARFCTPRIHRSCRHYRQRAESKLLMWKHCAPAPTNWPTISHCMRDLKTGKPASAHRLMTVSGSTITLSGWARTRVNVEPNQLNKDVASR